MTAANKTTTAAEDRITAAKNRITAAENTITAAKNTSTAAVIFDRSFLPTRRSVSMANWAQGPYALGPGPKTKTNESP